MRFTLIPDSRFSLSSPVSVFSCGSTQRQAGSETRRLLSACRSVCLSRGTLPLTPGKLWWTPVPAGTLPRMSRCMQIMDGGMDVWHLHQHVCHILSGGKCLPLNRRIMPNFTWNQRAGQAVLLLFPHGSCHSTAEDVWDVGADHRSRWV